MEHMRRLSLYYWEERGLGNFSRLHQVCNSRRWSSSSYMNVYLPPRAGLIVASLDQQTGTRWQLVFFFPFLANNLAHKKDVE